MTSAFDHTVLPRQDDQRHKAMRLRLRHMGKGLVPVFAAITIVLGLSACAVPSFDSPTPVYDSFSYDMPQTTVGAGDIHALDGNLVW